MSAWLETIPQILGLVFAVFSTAITGYRIANDIVSQRQNIKETKEEKFKEALKSDNIDVLGNYLMVTVGEINIREYVANSKVTNQVDSFIGRLENFIGTERDIEIESSDITPPKKITTLHPEGISSELKPIFQLIHSGEIWNGLAQLRREIEISFRKRITEFGNNELAKQLSVTRMLYYLVQHKEIPESMALPLKYIISICNKAIHGYDVSLEEAEEVVQMANMHMKYIKGTNLT